MPSSSNDLHYNGVKLREKAQQTLSALGAVGGRATTAQLLDLTPMDHRQSIHHQMDAYLVEADLVSLHEKEKMPGSTFDANVWLLTPFGARFYERHKGELATHLTRQELAAKYHDLHDRVVDLAPRVQNVIDRRELLEETSADVDDLDSLEQEIVEEIEKVDQRRSAVSDGLNVLRRRVSSLEKSTDGQMTVLEGKLKKRISKLEQEHEEKLNQLFDLDAEQSERIDALEEENSDLRDEIQEMNNTGLFGRLGRSGRQEQAE